MNDKVFKWIAGSLLSVLIVVVGIAGKMNIAAMGAVNDKIVLIDKKLTARIDEVSVNSKSGIELSRIEYRELIQMMSDLRVDIAKLQVRLDEYGGP